jgi:hypothetical protein
MGFLFLNLEDIVRENIQTGKNNEDKGMVSLPEKNPGMFRIGEWVDTERMTSNIEYRCADSRIVLLVLLFFKVTCTFCGELKQLKKPCLGNRVCKEHKLRKEWCNDF